jgi:uncharacterized SAM-binding protein YcdF (DUF218 family)
VATASAGFWLTARRATAFITALATVIGVLNGVAGYIIFGRAADSVVSHVDAVVVLGGEHDGRENYGVTLATEGLASTVLLSDPYPADDPLMSQICLSDHGRVEVICRRPDPENTRGEALMTRRLAVERRWRSILILSWQFHLPRARLVFDQCLSNIGVAVAVKAVPRHYVLPVWYWQYLYLYQFAGFVKAVSVDPC